MPILFRQTSHDIAFGRSPIEKMGGDNIVTYSMYGETPPLVLEDSDENEIIIKAYLENITYVLTDKGNLYGCGNNNSGALGDGTTTAVRYLTKVAKKVKDFSCILNRCCYITFDGKLYGCGENDNGELGLGLSLIHI